MRSTIYESPTLDVLSVVAEQGFALSNPQQNPSDWEDM